MVELKLIDFPRQRFTVTLNGQRVTFEFRYMSIPGAWIFNMYIADNLVLAGRKIVLDIDLLAPFSQFDVGIVFATDPEKAGNEPNRRNIPAGVVRIFQTTAEEVAAANAQ